MLHTTLPRRLAVALAASAWALLPLTGVVLAPAAPAAAEGSLWQLPLAGQPHVIRPFAPPRQRWLPGHRGVDLRAATGAAVTAAGAGRVSYAGTLAGRGVVAVDHGHLRTTYEPLIPAVRAGQQVARGSAIGRLALVGGHCAPAACLHWGLRRGQVYLDPMALLAGPVRLLPLGAASGSGAALDGAPARTSGPGSAAPGSAAPGSAEPAAAVRGLSAPTAGDRGPPAALVAAAAGGLGAAALALAVSRR